MTLVDAARDLVAELSGAVFTAPVSHVYQPLDYAWPMHEAYLRRYGQGSKRVVFLGMNPGPFGMAQTGIPFGEIAAVRDWLRLDAAIGAPARVHPKRPVLGLACPRSEPSGKRLWGLFAERFPDADAFFADHFVANYCPLVFMEDSGRNHTPDQLPASERALVEAACDRHLQRLIAALSPQWLVGVGVFAAKRAANALATTAPAVRIATIPHPSPANPAANRGWGPLATAALVAQGVWGAKRERME